MADERSHIPFFDGFDPEAEEGIVSIVKTVSTGGWSVIVHPADGGVLDSFREAGLVAHNHNPPSLTLGEACGTTKRIDIDPANCRRALAALVAARIMTFGHARACRIALR
jgi:hypothetical protein